MPTLNNPCELMPSDIEAHQNLDDDGNPWHPLDPEPEPAWEHALRARFDEMTALLQKHPMLSAGIALGAGFLLGRVLAARAS